MEKKWIFWTALGVLVFLVLLLIAVPGQKCGKFTTALLVNLDTGERAGKCGCLGIRYLEDSIGGGDVYCKGICTAHPNCTQMP